MTALVEETTAISDLEYRAMIWRRTRMLRMLHREPNRIDRVEALIAVVWPGERLHAESLRQAAEEKQDAP